MYKLDDVGEKQKFIKKEKLTIATVILVCLAVVGIRIQYALWFSEKIYGSEHMLLSAFDIIVTLSMSIVLLSLLYQLHKFYIDVYM